MEEKALTMMERTNFSTDTELKSAREKFDKQHSELQVRKERTCRKYKLGKTDSTPL